MAEDDDPFAHIGRGRKKDDDDPFAHIGRAQSDAATKKPTTSAGTAAARGFTGAASFGFRDEGSGLIAAGGGDPDNPDVAHALSSLAVGAYRKLTGDPEAERRYAAEVARQREQGKVLEAEHPIASTVGQIGGAVALPIGFAARGVAAGAKAGLAAKAGAAARTGAVTGGLTGLGEGEGTLTERLPGAVEGAGLGAAVGGAGSVVLSGLGAGARKVFQRPIETYRGLRGYGPNEEAQRFARATEADLPTTGGRVGLSEQEMAAAQARGQPVTALEQGEKTRSLARAAADASPEARTTISEPLEARFEDRGKRMVTWLKGHMMSEVAESPERKVAVREQGRLENKPLYDEAYRQGDRPLTSEPLQHALSTDIVQNSMKGAISKWRDRQVMEGYGNLKAPIEIDPRTQELVFTNSRGFPTEPNLQLWDYTARNLRGIASTAERAGDRDTAQRATHFANVIHAELDAMVPKFKDARASAKTFRGHENAVDFGRDFYGSSGTKHFKPDLRDFGKFSDQQKRIAADYYLERMAEDVANRPVALLNKFRQSDSFKEEIRTMLGPQRAAEIEDWVRVEALMERGRRDVLGGSPTSRLQQQAASWAQPLGQYTNPVVTGAGLGTLYAGEYNPMNPEAFAGAMLAALAKKGQLRLTAQNAKIMQQIASRLVSGDPQEYSQALQQITAKPALRRLLHEVTDPLTSGPATLGRVTGTFAGEQRGRPP